MKYFIFIIVFVFIAGCETKQVIHGNIAIEKESIANIKKSIGIYKTHDVLQLIGEPSYISPFNNNIWYYVKQKTASKLWFHPKIVEHTGYEIIFKDGYVIAVNQSLNPININIDQDKTEIDLKHQENVLIMMMRNIGRSSISPAGIPK